MPTFQWCSIHNPPYDSTWHILKIWYAISRDWMWCTLCSVSRTYAASQSMWWLHSSNCRGHCIAICDCFLVFIHLCNQLSTSLSHVGSLQPSTGQLPSPTDFSNSGTSTDKAVFQTVSGVHYHWITPLYWLDLFVTPFHISCLDVFLLS